MPINVSRLAKRIGIGLLLLFLLAGALVAIGPFYQRWRAEQLLALLQQTEVGKTTLPEFRSSAAKRLRFIGLNSAENEKRDTFDVFDRSATNPIGFETLAPWSIFSVQVSFDKGIAISKSAHFASGKFAEFSGTVIEWQHKPVLMIGSPVKSPPSPHHWAGFEYNPWHRFYIDDDVEATEAEKRLTGASIWPASPSSAAATLRMNSFPKCDRHSRSQSFRPNDRQTSAHIPCGPFPSPTRRPL